MIGELLAKGKVEIRPINIIVNTDLLEDFDPRSWLGEHIAPYQYLLAHTLDGVIWGVCDGTLWHLSCDLQIPLSPDLNQDELLELRLFSPDAEIYVWRDKGQFRGRTIQDDFMTPSGDCEAYDEPQILWGTKGNLVNNRFVCLEDGSQELAHIVPLPGLGNFDAGNKRPVHLCIRHYVEPDTETGLARVTMSRLVDLAFEFEEETDGFPS